MHELSHRFAARPRTLDEKARTVEAIASTGADVPRVGKRPDGSYGAWVERLDLAGADLTRLIGGPILIDHEQRSGSQVGVVDDARITRDGLVAVLRFSASAAAGEIFADVAAGIRRQVSVGYAVTEWAAEPTKGNAPVFTARRWQPLELSLVPIGADAAAGIRSLRPMDDDNMDSTAPAAGVAPVDPILAERTRTTEITKLTHRHGLMTLGTELIETGTSIENARARVLDELAARSEATAISSFPSVTGSDQGSPTNLHRRMGDALAHRLGSAGELPADAREFRSASIVEMARALLEARGERVRWAPPSDIIGRAMGTGDLPTLLQGTGNRRLAETFQHQRSELTALANTVRVPDFRTITRARRGEAPKLLEVSEHGEIKHGYVGEEAETYTVKTYARLVPMTRAALINDDLGAFDAFLGEMGATSAAIEADLIVEQLTTASGAGRTMGDGVALFHSSHKNLGTTGSPSLATLDEARSLLRVMPMVTGDPLNLPMAFLVVPAKLESTALALRDAEYVTSPGADFNPQRGRFEVLVEARLDAVSTTRWYAATDTARLPTLEIAYLDGTRLGATAGGPALEQFQEPSVLGLTFRAVLDVGVAAVNFRGIVRNTGS